MKNLFAPFRISKNTDHLFFFFVGLFLLCLLVLAAVYPIFEPSSAKKKTSAETNQLPPYQAIQITECSALRENIKVVLKWKAVLQSTAGIFVVMRTDDGKNYFYLHKEKAPANHGEENAYTFIDHLGNLASQYKVMFISDYSEYNITEKITTIQDTSFLLETQKN